MKGEEGRKKSKQAHIPISKRLKEIDRNERERKKSKVEEQTRDVEKKKIRNEKRIRYRREKNRSAL